MAKRKIKYQIIQLVVTAAGNEISKSADTDKLYQKVTGIHVSATDAKGLTNSVFNKFDINSEEIYCVGFEAKKLSPENVAFSELWDRDIDEPAANSPVSLKYKDGAAAGVTYPYTVNVYLRLENKD